MATKKQQAEAAAKEAAEETAAGEGAAAPAPRATSLGLGSEGGPEVIKGTRQELAAASGDE